MKSKNHFMSYRTPADMHSDGVYFNEELLARKKEIDEMNRKLQDSKNQ
ncbi:hypothetical protein [Olleya sp. YS]|nr:hypothetical protein [Olleya sp. YS]WGD33924.1 hypothetical protein Ollyesu_09045 [Olleya sp. YS]